jgi:hypothetical protein
MVLGACGKVLSVEPSEPTPDGAAADPDASAGDETAERGAPKCSWQDPFGKPVALANLNGAHHDNSARPTADELTLHYARIVSSGGAMRIHRATRASSSVPFGNPVQVSELGSTVHRSAPTVTPDGKTIIFTHLNATYELWSASRPALDAGFADAARLDGLSTGADHLAPFLTADGAELWFASDRGPGTKFRIYHVAWPATGGEPVPFDDQDAGAVVTAPVISSDKLTLYYGAGPASATAKIVVAHRDSVDAAFGRAVAVPELVGPTGGQVPDWLSPDDCRLYFTRLSAQAGVGNEIYVAARSPR